jgi:aspartyl/asparaginyl beta-hydroxylase (cupin superfamily)
LTADNSVFPQSNANDMRVTQDLNSFGEIIAHAHCSVDEKMSVGKHVDPHGHIIRILPIVALTL